MILFPAIDLRGGKCVRLVEGRFDKETVYADDPADMADTFREAGAAWLHVVDLDGALAGESRNRAVIRRILDHAGPMHVEVGGGIRSLEAAASLLDMGVSRVILGSLAARNPKAAQAIARAFPGRVVAGIDAKNGIVAVDGWGVSGGMHYLELGKAMAAIGIEHIIFTDISRDGKLEGLNVDATAELARTAGVKVIASGGVASLDDIRRAKAREADGIEGVIIGKALYTGRVDLHQALAVAAGK